MPPSVARQHNKPTAANISHPHFPNQIEYAVPPRARSLAPFVRAANNSAKNNHHIAGISRIQVEEEEKARLNQIYNEYQCLGKAAALDAPAQAQAQAQVQSPGASVAGPSRSSSLAKKNTELAIAAGPSSPTLSVNTQAVRHSRSNSSSEIADAAREIMEKERQREIKRKAALFELIDTERSFTKDLRMVVELFLLPIQLLGNRKIVEVIFGDLVKITEMNGMMYKDMVTRLGPLACLVDPERANRNRKKKKAPIKLSSSSSHATRQPRSVLQSSSLRSPTTPTSVSISASTTMSRRLSGSSNYNSATRRSSTHSYNEASTSASAAAAAAGIENMSLNRSGSRHDDRASIASNGDEYSVATSNSGSGAENGGLRYVTVADAASSAVAARNGSVRSLDSSAAVEFDEDDASRWTEDQVLDYFKNVCIGDVMANYLKDFSEHYARYSANHDKAVEYLKLVRESSARLNLRSDATRDAHQKLLQTLERAEKDDRVRRLRLESFLLAPVQRVMRYPLLLEALLKFTPEDHTDHEDVALALSISGSVATEVDRKSEELMNRHRLAELQSTFDWSHLLGGVQLKLDTFTKLVGQRKFVRKGPLRKATSGRHLYAILFNDFMMITMSDRRGGVWCYEAYRLPIQTYDLLAREPVKDMFELVNLKDNEILQLRADSSGEAADWVRDINKTANYCYDVLCEAIRSGIQVSKVKSIHSPEARQRILMGGKPSNLSKRH
ncbi:hypothetical protein J3B02_001298 [Coemansia erecta]|uniref:Dbl homology domain-containing protein n=1 Tax=Coemansia asiatica TaxID=1052880 RepID=A0A9W8CKK9_9FUNG|nr:hypothetical protein LPJ64_000766 [Coemansia asiatica]KAJ2856971.1 hypothetical protein J3B02_001298 [Coemansia erecta]KAJ2884152.1 hypothetical protein FB639_002015 [Coemansia asiatica]